jgi:hypothetical protein
VDKQSRYDIKDESKIMFCSIKSGSCPKNMLPKVTTNTRLTSNEIISIADGNTMLLINIGITTRKRLRFTN